MECYKQNSCRLCEQVFCCVKCRIEHEKSKHNVENPECDICVYGKIVLRNFSQELLEHIEKNHWPLHCLRCKRLFGSVEELVNHNKCSWLHNNNNKALLKPPTEVRYDSPFGSFTNQEFNGILPNIIATSTPTSREEMNDKENENVKILTLDVCAEKSILVKVGVTPNDSKKNENSLKRRVTFCETPVSEYSGRKKLLIGQKSESIEEEDVGQKSENKITTSTGSKTRENIKSKHVPISPLTDSNYDSSPGTGNAQVNNQQFYEKMINPTITSTPMSVKEDKLPETIKIENINTNHSNSTTNKTPEDVKIKEEMKFEIDYQTPLSAPDKYRQALCHQDNEKKLQTKGKESIETGDNINADNERLQLKEKGEIESGDKINTDDTSSQFFSIKQTPSINTWVIGKATEEDENMHNELVNENYNKNNVVIEETLWMSAINTSEMEGDGGCPNANQNSDENNEIVSVQVKKLVCLPQNISTTERESITDISSKMNLSKSGIWGSMTQAIKSVVTGLSSIKSGNESSSSKRAWTDDDDDTGPDFKRMKIADVKCRRTIRAICPLSHTVVKIMVDKATQTD